MHPNNRLTGAAGSLLIEERIKRLLLCGRDAGSELKESAIDQIKVRLICRNTYFFSKVPI
jgi:hypothetical protein